MMAASFYNIAKDFHVLVFVPGHLPGILNPVVVDGLKMAVVTIPRVKITRKAKCAVTVDSGYSRVTASVGRPYCDQLTPTEFVSQR
jgi:hypothetical protein